MFKIKYSFNIRHRFSFEKEPERLYLEAFDKLSVLDKPWGLKGQMLKPLPPAKKNYSTGVVYTRELGAPIRSFGLGFMNRNLTEPHTDQAMWDDSLRVDFNINHKAVDYGYLVREVFPVYITAMDAYYGVLEEINIMVQDASFQDSTGAWATRPDYIDPRKGVRRIWPANYWDRELCRRAFGLSPEAIMQRLTGKVAEARMLNDGVLVIYSYERVPDEKIVAIDGEIRPLLKQ